MTFRRITSAGWPSFSYIASKNSGSISPIIRRTAPLFPKTPRVKMYAGTPIAAAAPKQINWRLVRFSATFVLTIERSLGTFTNAIRYSPNPGDFFATAG